MGYKKRQPSLQRNKNNISANKQYNKHIKLMYAGMICLIAGLRFHQLFVAAVFLELCGLILLFKNWKRINNEYEQMKLAKKK